LSLFFPHGEKKKRDEGGGSSLIIWGKKGKFISDRYQGNPLESLVKGAEQEGGKGREKAAHSASLLLQNGRKTGFHYSSLREGEIVGLGLRENKKRGKARKTEGYSSTSIRGKGRRHDENVIPDLNQGKIKRVYPLFCSCRGTKNSPRVLAKENGRS